MSSRLDPDDVMDMLCDLGLWPISARKAAYDQRIAWTQEAIVACMYDIEHSKSEDKPAGLWSTYLLHGRLPVMPVVKSIPDTNEPDTSCPVCKGDIRECRGLHGFVLNIPCWQCQKPMGECRGMCQRMVATTRRSTRKKRKEEAA